MSTDPRIEAAAKAIEAVVYGKNTGKPVSEECARAALAAIDKAATIADWHALEAMPVLSSILHGGYIWEKAGPGSWESVDGYVRHSIDLTPAYVRSWGTE